MPFPPRTMSIHDAPQAGERANMRALRRLVRRPSDPIVLTPSDYQRFADACGLTPEQEDADAREQQAIADAVEGVIP